MPRTGHLALELLASAGGCETGEANDMVYKGWIEGSIRPQGPLFIYKEDLAGLLAGQMSVPGTSDLDLCQEPRLCRVLKLCPFSR